MKMDDVFERERELIGLVKDMQDRERRMHRLLEKIILRLKDLEARVEKLEGHNNE